MSWQTALRKTTARLTQGFSRPMFRTKDVDWDRLVSLDFETYYDDDYTLKKLSTSEYVRDKRFKAQMVGIKIGLNKPTRIYGPKQIAAALKKINWATHALLCHHTQFDGLILSHHYGIVPSYYYDTLSMARGLHSNEIGAGLEEVSLYYGGQGKLKDVLDTTKGVLDWPPALFKSVSPYCANDTDEMLRVFREMHLSMPAKEMDLIDIIVRMFCDPMLKLDVPRVEAELAREIAERKALMINVLNPREHEADIKLTGKEKLANPVGEARDLLTVKKVVGSNERFADLLRAEGIEPPVKISKSWMAKPRDQRKDEDKWTYAFAKDDLEFTSLPDDVEKLGADLDLNKPADIKVLAARQTRLRALVDVRLSVKSTTNITRAQRFLSSADGGLALPVYYAYSRAHTHRLGGGDKRNYQNLQRGGELRQSIEAPPGHVLGVSDSGQIEARVNAMLWGQNDLITQFRNKEDPYCSLATILYGRTITPADKTERFVGKVCLAGDTRVLTNHGVKSIVEVRLTDLLWDGVEWVNHKGLIDQGVKPVLRKQGLAATADHEILTEHGWLEWREVLTDLSLFRSALCSAKPPWCAGNTTPRPRESSGATARSVAVPAGVRAWSTSAVSAAAAQLGAMHAQRSPQAQSATGSTRTPWPTTSIAPACSTACPRPSLDVTTLETLRSSTTGFAASRWLNRGVMIVQRSFATCRRFLAGITQRWTWTEPTRTATTNQATSDSFLAPSTPATSAESKISNPASAISSETTRTYDLVNAGPRSRFTVITDAGELIVHNCRLGLGFGMGAPKLQMTLVKGALGGPPLFVPLEMCTAWVRAYRNSSAYIVKGWAICNQIIEDMAVGRTGNHGPISWEANKIWGPNGLFLHYPDLKKSVDDNGWDQWTYRSGDIRKKLYGGLLCENIVQFLARIIVMGQLLEISKTARVVMTTHDEVVACVKKAQAELNQRRMLKIMATSPDWWPDIPLAAEGGYATNYSK